MMRPIEALNQKIQKMSMMRLKHEERDKDKRLHQPGDPYFGKPMEYAMDILGACPTGL